MRGYYQIAGLPGRLLWSWLLMLPVAGIIMWLEATKFNQVTAILFLIFLVIAGGIFYRQRVELSEDSLRLRPAFGVHSDWILLTEIKYVQFTKRTILFTYAGEQYAYWLSPSIHAALKVKLADATHQLKEDYDTRAIND